MAVDLGVGPALIQLKDLKTDHLATGLTITLICTLLISGIFWILSPYFADLMHIDELRNVAPWFAVVIFARGISGYFQTMLARNFKAKNIALSDLSSWIFSTFLVAMPLAYAGYGYWALVLAAIVEAVGNLILVGIASRNYLPMPGFDLLIFKELIFLSSGYAATRPLGFLTGNVDRFLITRLLGVADLGIYSRAAFLAKTASNMFGNVMKLAVFPSMAKIQDESSRFEGAVLKGLAITALMTLPVGIFASFFAQEIVDVLLGEQWKSAVVPFSIFSLTFYFRLTQRNYTVIFEALGRPYVLLPINAVYLFLLSAGIMFTAKMGINVVSAAIALAMVVMYIMNAAVAIKYSKIQLKKIISVHRAPALTSSVVIIGSLIVKSLPLNVNSFIELLIAGCFIGSLIGGLALLWPRIFLGSYFELLVINLIKRGKIKKIIDRIKFI